ncbi:MAG: class I SAM-dependent methyltransferase [bacterium]
MLKYLMVEGRINILSGNDLKEITVFYKHLYPLTENRKGLKRFKNYLKAHRGARLLKHSGQGKIHVIFSNTLKSDKTNNKLIINLRDRDMENQFKIHLANAIISFKFIKISLRNFWLYNSTEKYQLDRYFDQIHPEALILFPICKGKGVDIGCGYRKTHPETIGVDWIKKGGHGLAGNVLGKISEADVQSNGDKLKMFQDNSLDYVVSRHNLEHYKNPKKTLEEWLRVLKPEGWLGIVVPNGHNPATYDKTHYYNFTLKDLEKMITNTGKVKIIKIGECIPEWSFYCIGKKI